MSVRLNKAIKECNVGLQTAVEFLQNRGFADVETNMNAKISDEQYELLLKEFKPDSTLRDTAKEKIQQQKEEKERKEKERQLAKLAAEAEAKAKAEAEARRRAEEKAKMTPKVVGHIDLDKPKAAKTEPAKEPVEELANEPAIQPVDKTAAEPVIKPTTEPAVETGKPEAVNTDNDEQIITDGYGYDEEWCVPSEHTSA